MRRRPLIPNRHDLISMILWQHCLSHAKVRLQIGDVVGSNQSIMTANHRLNHR